MIRVATANVASSDGIDQATYTVTENKEKMLNGASHVAQPPYQRPEIAAWLAHRTT